MIIPNSIKKKYDELLPIIEKLQEKVNETLYIYTNSNSYTYINRVKSLNSLCEKIESGRYHKWLEIDDLFASTIIIPTLSHEEKVIKDISNLFNVIEKRERGTTNKAPNVFRFDSTRIICTLKYYGEKYPINDIYFEIQIKSAFEFAWSITTHSLTYKTDKPSWERQRLSSHIKAVVEQVDILLLGFEESSQLIKKSNYHEVEIISKICDFINTLETVVKDFPSELKPKDLSRCSENLYYLLQSSKWFTKKKENTKITDIYDEILSLLKDKVSELSHIPRSITLNQLFLGILVDNNIIQDNLSRFTPLITDELMTFFPNTKKIISKFEI